MERHQSPNITRRARTQNKNPKNGMIKPKHILGFLILTLLLMAIISFFFPKSPVQLGKIQIKYRSIEDIIHPQKIEYADISNIVKTAEIIELTQDSMPITPDSISTDTIRANADLLAASQYPLQGNIEGYKKLHNAFSLMEKASNSNRPVRIMHFGDSQIEADRITSFIREKLQQQFGGNGPGLLEMKPVTQKLTWQVDASDSWKRYTLFGKIDSTITHTDYGPMFSLFRFAPPWQDSISSDSAFYEAEIQITNRYMGYAHAKNWDVCKVFYGNLHKPASMQLCIDQDSIISTDSLYPVSYPKTLNLTGHHDEFTLKFSGWDSPDFYAISLESKQGVIVDNIALRGSAGTLFSKMNDAMLKGWFKRLNTKLLFLEFGVNVVGDERTDFTYYENWFYSQLMHIKQLQPDIAIIVIGISDMSKKDGTNYITHPAVPKIRNAQKNATLKSGYVFWDMYEAMGGKNSMPSWVWAEPSLASTDFTHFNNRGAGIIANMFFNALMLEYTNYSKTK
jgi:lysophospholipase L1-like esterase